MSSLAFLLGVLEEAEPAHVAWEDFTGPHGNAVKLWQRMGFLGRDPGLNPVPSCPHCSDGVPYRLRDRFLCHRCHSTVDPNYLLLWPLDLGAFLRWLARKLKLRRDVRPIDGQLWQLGEGEDGGMRFECFYYRAGALSEAEKMRLDVYRHAVILYGLSRPATSGRTIPCVSLLEVLNLGRALTINEKSALLRTRGTVRFDRETGALFAADVCLGEVPVGSKEFFLLSCLAEHIDRFVPYTDIKHFVLRQTGGKDSTEEASFCHKLKRRIKKEWIPRIDQFITTTNKADGYRLRGDSRVVTW